jgi:hypothetical protein
LRSAYADDGTAPASALKSTPVRFATSLTIAADPPDTMKSPGVKPSPDGTRRTDTFFSSSRLTARNASFSFVLTT